MAKTSVKEKVLHILHEHRGTYYSGQELAEELQVSRTAVWKAINGLREEGYHISGSTKLGYTMDVTTDILSSDAILNGLTQEANAFYQLQCLTTVDSTNNAVREQGVQGAAEGLCVIAEEQTAGRGRKGRAFYSPDATGLYLSILLRPSLSFQDATLITTAAAVAGAKACEAANDMLSSGDVQIKWVNDLFLHGKKISGILTEAFLSMETGELDYAIMGIGFNLCPPKDGWPEAISHVAGSLFDKECPSGTRNIMASTFLNEFYKIYDLLPDVRYMKEYRSRQLAMGKEVYLLSADSTSVQAKVLDIDDRGQLVVRLAGSSEMTTVNSGEISIKL